jgi:Tn3 transposase DDE domain
MRRTRAGRGRAYDTRRGTAGIARSRPGRRDRLSARYSATWPGPRRRSAHRHRVPGRPHALGLVLNAVVLWNTRYTDAAVAQLRAHGEAGDADAARLSPLVDAHVNMLGRYAFTQLPGAGLRPLRNPNEPGEES